MQITRNPDGTTTITANEEEIDHLWASTQIQAWDEDNRPETNEILQKIADQLHN